MKKQIKLFCIPYAGGSAQSIYHKWSDHLDSKIELRPIELAGRGARIAENLHATIEEAIDDVLEQIKDEIIHHDYAIFGHSMGSILTYKVLQRIEELQLPAPIHAFFSGRRAPHCPSRKKIPYSRMNDSELMEEIKKLGGTPPEFFEYPELRSIFLPIFKSDLKIAETLVDKSALSILKHNISVFIGKDENVTTPEVHEWKQCTSQKCFTQYFEGGHFFLLDQQQAIIDNINTCLLKDYQYISA